MNAIYLPLMRNDDSYEKAPIRISAAVHGRIRELSHQTMIPQVKLINLLLTEALNSVELVERRIYEAKIGETILGEQK